MKNQIAYLGGIFIHAENPEMLAEWYQENFGLSYEYTKELKLRGQKLFQKENLPG